MNHLRYFLKRTETGFDLDSETVEVPTPSDKEVLVRMRAVSLNRRDFGVRTLTYGTPAGSDLFTPLSDGAGEVVAIGQNVTSVKVGDCVASTFFPNWIDGPVSAEKLKGALGAGGPGVFAEHVVLAETGVAPIPSGWSFNEGATMGCAAVTAWSAVSRLGGLKPGESVLVIGTGGVAIFALQITKALGGKLVIISSSDEKLARAKSLGADHLVNYVTHPEWEKEVRGATGGAGVNHAVELGGAGTLQKSLASLGVGGHIALIGALAGFGGDIPSRTMVIGGLRASAVLVGSRADHLGVQDLMVKAGIKPVIDSTFNADAARDAYDRLESGAFGKVVIEL